MRPINQTKPAYSFFFLDQRDLLGRFHDDLHLFHVLFDLAFNLDHLAGVVQSWIVDLGFFKVLKRFGEDYHDKICFVVLVGFGIQKTGARLVLEVT